jgi:hypothetical protein
LKKHEQRREKAKKSKRHNKNRINKQHKHELKVAKRPGESRFTPSKKEKEPSTILPPGFVPEL